MKKLEFDNLNELKEWIGNHKNDYEIGDRVVIHNTDEAFILVDAQGKLIFQRELKCIISLEEALEVLRNGNN